MYRAVEDVVFVITGRPKLPILVSQGAVDIVSLVWRLEVKIKVVGGLLPLEAMKENLFQTSLLASSGLLVVWG